MMQKKQAVAIRHVSFEDLGTWEPVLKDNGYDVQYVEAGVDNILSLDTSSIHLLFVLGGPIGACQNDEYPFLLDEYKAVEARLKTNLPIIGICLGAQILAHVLGAKVYPNSQKEIGWHSLQLTSQGLNSPIRHFDSQHTSMFHWHGDTFDLPNESALLASTPLCKNQIFSAGKNALGFQCHPEVCQKKLEKWWIGHACELESQKICPNNLREETLQQGPALKKQAERFLTEWLGIP